VARRLNLDNKGNFVADPTASWMFELYERNDTGTMFKVIYKMCVCGCGECVRVYFCLACVCFSVGSECEGDHVASFGVFEAFVRPLCVRLARHHIDRPMRR